MVDNRDEISYLELARSGREEQRQEYLRRPLSMDNTLKSSKLATSTLANSYRLNPIDKNLSGSNPGKTYKFRPCPGLQWQPMYFSIEIAKRTKNTTPNISKPLRRNNYIVIPQGVPSWNNYVHPQMLRRLQIDGATP